MSEQQEYRVTWEIEVTADSADDAARRALEIQRDPESWATVFDVSLAGSPGPLTRLDLSGEVSA